MLKSMVELILKIVQKQKVLAQIYLFQGLLFLKKIKVTLEKNIEILRTQLIDVWPEKCLFLL